MAVLFPFAAPSQAEVFLFFVVPFFNKRAEKNNRFRSSLNALFFLRKRLTLFFFTTIFSFKRPPLLSVSGPVGEEYILPSPPPTFLGFSQPFCEDPFFFSSNLPPLLCVPKRVPSQPFLTNLLFFFWEPSSDRFFTNQRDRLAFSAIALFLLFALNCRARDSPLSLMFGFLFLSVLTVVLLSKKFRSPSASTSRPVLVL